MTFGRVQLLRSTLLAVLAAPGVAATAIGQEAPGERLTIADLPKTDAPEEADVVVVTGSRIARAVDDRDYAANSPIVTVGQEDIQATGVTTVDTLINEMPQFVGTTNMTSNNPGNGGQANISLRGLGANRTLVLLNGRRVVPESSIPAILTAVDVNILPSQLIERVETITGGASATYGSDAIAGVTNFILRNDFEGLEIATQFGQTDQGDGNTEAVSIAAGGPFDDGRGHATMMLSYNRRDSVYADARDFSRVFGPSTTSPLGNTVFDAGNPAQMIPGNLPTLGAVQAAVPGAAANDVVGGFGFNDDGSLFVYRNRLGFISPGGVTFDGFAQPGPTFSPNFLYNIGPLNLLSVPQTRYNAFGMANYEINNFFEVYGEALFTRYESAQELAPTPVAASTGTGLRVPVSNPFIPAELRAVLASRPDPLGSFALDKRFNALGPRRSDEIFDVYQVTSGVRGDLGFGDWTYDLYGTFGRVNRTSIQNGNVSRSAVQTLLNATDGGASLCAGGFNPFGLTTLSDACKGFIGRTAKALSINELRNVEFSAQGGAFQLPAGEVRVAAGLSYREDGYTFLPDAILTAPVSVQPCIATTAFSGAGLPQSACAVPTTATPRVPNQPALAGPDIAGFNAVAPVDGAVDVTDGFAEVLIPLVKDLPLAREVNLTLAGRTSDYSTVGNVETYKADVDWTIIDGLRLRGGYQQAIRAPAVGELFMPVTRIFTNIGTPVVNGMPAFSGDPCDINGRYRSTTGANLAAPTNAQVRALCITQGVSSAVIDSFNVPSPLAPTLTGGNQNLAEETAKTYSIGLVWESQFDAPWLANLRASVDYYSIEIEDAVGTVSASAMLQQCFNANGVSNPTYDPNNFFCQLFSRDANGNITNATSFNQNLAAAETSGVDFQVDWAMDIGPGTLDAGVIGTWLEKLEQQLMPGAPFQDLAGKIGTSGALGGILGVAQPEWKFLASTNYRIGPYRIGARWRHIGEMTNFNVPTDKIPAIGYFDLLGAWKINDNLSLQLNVNNVLDEQPPLYAPSIQNNTDGSTYDVLGRRYTIGLTAKF